jgi:ABC-type sulfate transport system substrate-binding protein
LLEYRRDIGRFLRCERDTYPTPPIGYFDRETTDILVGVQEQAVRDRRPEILADFPFARVEKNLAKTWDTTAVQVYGNWLTYLCAQKERRMNQRQIRKAVGMNDIGVRSRAAAV